MANLKQLSFPTDFDLIPQKFQKQGLFGRTVVITDETTGKKKKLAFEIGKTKSLKYRPDYLEADGGLQLKRWKSLEYVKKVYKDEDLSLLVYKTWLFVDIDSKDKKLIEDPNIQKLISKCKTYTELSMSGRGIHMLFENNGVTKAMIGGIGETFTECGMAIEVYVDTKHCALTFNTLTNKSGRIPEPRAVGPDEFFALFPKAKATKKYDTPRAGTDELPRHKRYLHIAMACARAGKSVKEAYKEIVEFNNSLPDPKTGKEFEEDVWKILGWVYEKEFETEHKEAGQKPNIVPIRKFGDFQKCVGEEPPYIIDKFLQAQSLTMLQGPPKSMKSMISIDMAMHVATGTDYHGFRTPGARKVVYMQYELADWALNKRLENLSRNIPNKDLLNDNLSIVTVTQQDAKGGGRLPTIAVTNNNTGKQNQGIKQGWDQFVEQLANDKPDLLIVDPLRNLFVGDENDASVAMEVMDALTSIRDRIGCSVFVCHHYSKSGANNDSPSINDARGSSVWGAAPDCIIPLRTTRTLKDDGTYEVFTQVMSPTTRNDTPFQTFTLRLANDGDGFNITKVDNNTFTEAKKENKSNTKKEEVSVEENVIFNSWVMDLNNGRKVYRTQMQSDLEEKGIKNARKRCDKLCEDLVEKGFVRSNSTGNKVVFTKRAEKTEQETI